VAHVEFLKAGSEAGKIGKAICFQRLLCSPDHGVARCQTSARSLTFDSRPEPLYTTPIPHPGVTHRFCGHGDLHALPEGRGLPGSWTVEILERAAGRKEFGT
jgi:hypothetical protein